MSMNPVGRTLDNEDQKLIKEYIKNGGEVTKIKYGERSEDINYTSGFYQRKKKKKEADAE